MGGQDIDAIYHFACMPYSSDSIPGLIPNFPIADNMSEIALAIRNRSEGFRTQDPGGCIAYGDP